MEEIKDDDDDFIKDDDEDDILKGLTADDDMAELLQEETKEEASDIFIPPTHGVDHLAQSLRESIVPGYYVAFGDFKTALDLLRK